MKKSIFAQSLKIKITFGIWLIWQIVIALSCRPVQDDYAYLDIGSNSGFAKYLSDFWNSWGGNLAPSIIRIPFYLPSISGNQWWGLALYSFLTSLVVLFSSIILTTWLRGKPLVQFDSRDLILGFVTCVGFEGLFTPGVLAAFVFGSTSSTHLLPICSLIIGLWLCTLDRKTQVTNLFFFPLLFILGFIAGNCNFAEGGLAVVSSALLLICFRMKNETAINLGLAHIGKLLMFSTGTFIGFLTIIVSPGFKKRADSGNGLPSGLEELIIGFRSSFVSFSGDVITHPVWIALSILLLLFFKQSLKEEIVRSRAMALILLTALCYASLIIGTAFAYAAWHQSVGLLFLLTPCSLAVAYFLLPFEDVFIRLSSLFKVSIVVLTLLILILLVRVTVLEVQRGSNWDKNLLTNGCLIGADNQAKLLGAEVRYPPIALGIEDVNRWEWMSNNYKNWLSSPNFKNSPSCE